MAWAWTMAIVQTIACALAAASVVMALATRRRMVEMATHHKVAREAWETENRSLRSLVDIQTATIDAQARRILDQDKALGLVDEPGMTRDRLVAGTGAMHLQADPSPTVDRLAH